MLDNSYSAMTRVEAWKILFRIFMQSPIFGTGLANYYFYTPLFPILGYSVSFNSHNNYMDLLVETGVVGTGLFVWFFVQTLRMGLGLKDRCPEGFLRAFVYAALGGVVGTMVSGMLGDWIIPFIYNVGFSGFRASMFAWLFMGGLLAVERFLTVQTQSNP
jgi:O-antigen ligase